MIRLIKTKLMRWIYFGAALAALPTGHPEAKASCEDQNPYARKGNLDIGGAIALAWAQNTFGAEVGPTLGYFVIDRVQISALLNYIYQRDETNTAAGKRIIRSGDGVLELSYHHPLSPTLLVLAGAGPGAEWDNSSTNFEIAPRVGLNLKIGSSAVLTPAFRIPIRFAENGTNVGIQTQIGIGASF